MARHPDVLVIGGGITGWSTAWSLLRRGLSVSVVDNAAPGQATYAGAGVVAPGMSFRPVEAYYPIAQVAVAYYPPLIAELAEVTTIDPLYETVGAVMVALTEEEAGRLPEAQAMMQRRIDGGMPNLGQLTPLGTRQAQALFPPLTDVPAALHVSGAARVSGARIRDALRDASLAKGASELTGRAELSSAGGQVSVAVEGQVLPAGQVVLAGGAWSGELTRPLGIELAVKPQRGQILHLAFRDQTTSNWPIITGFFDHYLVPFAPNRVVCGATREIDSGFAPLLTAGGVAEVLAKSLSVAPGLGSAEIAEMRVGLRPLSPDLLPFLGKKARFDNLYLNTGHGPTGLQLGPWSGDAVAGMINGEPAPIDLSACDPDRPISFSV